MLDLDQVVELSPNPETSIDGVRWRYTQHPEARLARFGAEAVVFNPVSWETHLLNQTAAHIVDSLCSGLGGPWELAKALTSDLDPDSPPEVYVDQVTSLLEELEALGLVFRERPPSSNPAR